ncbi:MAG: ATP synthase subunit I [Myxococcales bacterium]|nr:MAG: ATP synthase subunit I [Myxococcales bacterium]
MEILKKDAVFIWILGLGAFLALACGLLFGVQTALGLCAGCLLGAANWAALRWLGKRLSRQSLAPAAVVFIYVLKMSALFLLMAIALSSLKLHPLGFIVGLSTMVVGILAGSLINNAGSSLEEGE